MDLFARYVKVCSIDVLTHVVMPGIMRDIVDENSHARSV